MNAKPDLLADDEVRAGLEALTKQDRVRLDKMASLLSFGTGQAPQDVINDAVCAVLEGVRSCRRDMPLVATLIGVMKSRVWWARKQSKDWPESLDDFDPDDKALTDRARRPDEVLLAKEDFERRQAALEEIFTDDETAQLVLIGQFDGTAANDIRDQVGLSKTEYATVLRRIRRKMERAIREGWPK